MTWPQIEGVNTIWPSQIRIWRSKIDFKDEKDVSLDVKEKITVKVEKYLRSGCLMESTEVLHYSRGLGLNC